GVPGHLPHGRLLGRAHPGAVCRAARRALPERGRHQPRLRLAAPPGAARHRGAAARHRRGAQPGAGRAMTAVSIVIPTRNKAPRLRLPLACLAEQRVGAFEVVLVDDGSVDGTVEVIADYRDRLPLRVVSGPGAGRAAARNTGAAHARADYLVFLDDDILT